jgi:hypothetical protein
MRRKGLLRDAFNTLVSRFLKDVLEMFAVTSVNDELIASATPQKKNDLCRAAEKNEQNLLIRKRKMHRKN